MIDNRLLQYFLAVAEEQNFTHASKRLHTTQSNLSKQIKILEDQIGKPLLVRGKRLITLTEEGKFLRDRAREILSLVHKTEKALSSQDKLLAGDITIGCGETPMMEFITKVMVEVNKQHPNIKFHIWSGNADAVIEKLDAGIVDLGVVIAPAYDDHYAYINLDMNEQLGILMPSDHPLAEKEYLTAEDLKDQPLIISAQTFNSRGTEFLDYLGNDAQELNVVATYNLIYNATLMVKQKFGIAVCLEKLIKTSYNDPAMTFRSLRPQITQEIYIITKKYRVLSPAADFFLKTLREQLKHSEHLSYQPQ